MLNLFSISRYYHEAITANIAEFLKNRNHIIVRTDDDGSSFKEFLRFICAEGDTDLCLREWKARSETDMMVIGDSASISSMGSANASDSVSGGLDASIGGGAAITRR